MHKKIIGVVLLAALLAAGLGFLLLSKDKDSVPVTKSGEITAGTNKAPSPLSGRTTSLPPRSPLNGDKAASGQPVFEGPKHVRPEGFGKTMTTLSGFAFAGSVAKVQTLTEIITLTDEQQVMAAAYYEALDRVNLEQSKPQLGSAQTMPRERFVGRAGNTPVLRPSLDARIADFEIKAQELKQVRSLRDKFLRSLSKTQKDKIQMEIENGTI